MKYLGLVYSGTGNTLRVCNKAKLELEKRGHSLEVVDVINGNKFDVNDYDGLFIFYPIYAFNCPKPMIKYVKKIKKANINKPCVIMKQSGEHLFWNNASSLYLTSILKRRNIKVHNEYHYLMPYCFIFRHTDYMAHRMNNVMEELLPLDLDAFLIGQDVKIKRFFMDRPFAFVLRIQWWGGRFNGLFYRVEKQKCVKCMKCVNSCPANNIKFKDGKFKFGYQCLMCQKCVMYCPQHAIKVGLFNTWRVDQPYTFKEAEPKKTKHDWYCRKNYERYFRESEKRISEAKN